MVLSPLVPSRSPFIFLVFARRTINPRPINQRPFLAGTFWQGNWELFGKRRYSGHWKIMRYALSAAAHSHSIHIPKTSASARYPRPRGGFIYRERAEFRRPEFGRSIIARTFSPEIFSRPINRPTVNRSAADLITGLTSAHADLARRICATRNIRPKSGHASISRRIHVERY